MFYEMCPWSSSATVTVRPLGKLTLFRRLDEFEWVRESSRVEILSRASREVDLYE
jgi:hypothetical protein